VEAEGTVLPTIRALLDLAEIAAGLPEVVAGEDALDAPVRWVHVTELADIGRLLEGGELVLTTGLGIPSDDAAQRRFVDDLAAAGVAGLVVELGRRFTVLPAALVEAATARAFPVIALHREVRFVAITQAVHELIITRQVRLLRRLDVVHRTFTDLLMAELLHGRHGSLDEWAGRVQALGVSLAGRRLQAMVVRGDDTGRTGIPAEARSHELAQIVRLALAGRPTVLVGTLAPMTVGVIVGLEAGDRDTAWIDQVAADVRSRVSAARLAPGLTIGVGTPADDVADLGRSLREAAQVADAARGLTDPRAWHGLPDLGVRGLVVLLHDDDRVHAFVDRMLGRALGSDDGDELLATLRGYLDAAGHKSRAAERLRVSRGTLYARLERIRALLDVDLDDGEVRTSLHLALLARDVIAHPQGP